MAFQWYFNVILMRLPCSQIFRKRRHSAHARRVPSSWWMDSWCQADWPVTRILRMPMNMRSGSTTKVQLKPHWDIIRIIRNNNNIKYRENNNKNNQNTVKTTLEYNWSILECRAHNDKAILKYNQKFMTSLEPRSNTSKSSGYKQNTVKIIVQV